MIAYRASVHETTGYTPNMMILGREVMIPLKIQFANQLQTNEIE